MKINRRQLISYIGCGVGTIAFSACGGKTTEKGNATTENIEVSNIAELRHLRTRLRDGQLINVGAHTIEGVGGGTFQVDLTNRRAIDDNGSIIVGWHGNVFKRINVTTPTAEMFGASVDKQDDQSIFINRCTSVYGACYLQGGKTYNIQHPVTAIVLKTYGEGNATLNLISPSGDNKFGVSPYADSAGVYCNGDIGKPLLGVDVQNIIVKCNGLFNSSKNVGVKGFLFMRCHGFYQQNCFVYDSSSYAFWDADADARPLTIMTYCSGTRENCFATDCQISFEQVNCRGVTLNNCHAYRSDRELPYPVEALFHFYGGSDMQVVYKNCSGIADGQCTAVVSALRECKNILITDSQFINNFNNGGDIQGGVYFGWQGGNYNGIQFKNCTIISLYSPSVVLTVGEFGSSSAEFNFTNCIIKGYQIGVGILGNGGGFTFKNCDVEARASDEVVPWAYYSDRAPSSVQVMGGSASALGDVVLGPSNMTSNIFDSVILNPPLN